MDGGYNVWLRHYVQTYFVLRADPEHEPEVQGDVDEEEGLFITFFQKWFMMAQKRSCPNK